MKKILSVLLSAVIGTAAVGSIPAVAEDTTTAPASGGVVIFGDSIAAGYGLDPASEYNYGQIIGDYLGCDVENYAKSGDTTFDMLEKLDALTDEQKAAVADSDYVIISIGGNDLMHYASKKILDFAAKNDLLNEGFTSANIPEDPSITDVMVMVNLQGEGGFMDYASSGITAYTNLIKLLKTDIAANLRFDNSKYDGYIPTTIIPNISTAVTEIKAINPDARVIVQTIYQPLQIDPDFIEAEYGMDSNYADMLGVIRSNFKDILDTFRTELKTVEGIEIADVYYQFTSVPDGEAQNNYNPGYAYMFTKIQAEGNEKDFHPTQKGHLAIAATILDTIGELHDAPISSLLNQVYFGLDSYTNGSKYPLLALDTFKKVAGNILNGDIDFNGAIDGSDATLALKAYAAAGGGGLKPVLSNIQHDCADTNHDTAVDGSDATNILRYYAMSSSGYDGTFDELVASMTSSGTA